MKGYPYAVWFGMPVVAVAVAHLFRRFKLKSLAARVFLVIAVTPAAVTGIALGLMSAIGLQDDAVLTAHNDCIDRRNITAFAALSPGLIVADELDWGPYLLAWTPHHVLAAPYHRLSDAVLMAQRILASPPDTARPLLSLIGADYLLICGTRGPVSVTGAALDASLWGRLQAGQAPDWAERLQLDAGPWKIISSSPSLNAKS